MKIKDHYMSNGDERYICMSIDDDDDDDVVVVVIITVIISCVCQYPFIMNSISIRD